MIFTQLRNVVVGFGLVLLVVASASARAQEAPTEGTAQAASPQPVLTRAQVRSFHQEPNGKAYVRLKLLPKSKLPFTVQTFRVLDPTLTAGIVEGAWVKFSSRRVDGENAVASIQVVAECQRFQPCD
jgi:Cu/Ag efflux protein CusF